MRNFSSCTDGTLAPAPEATFVEAPQPRGAVRSEVHGPAVMAGSPAPNILIVDDNLQNRRLLEALLRADGYLTRSAASGEQTLEMVQERMPDLILLDLHMPGIDGYQVARAIKGEPATSNIPIIMVTALADRDARVASLHAGADEFLTKPIERAELSVRVRNLLRLKSHGDFLENHSQMLEREVQARTVDLQRLATAMDATTDAIFLTDRSSMGFVHVNDMACRMLGKTRGEVLALGPDGAAGTTREELEHNFDALIDGGGTAEPLEIERTRPDGARAWVELRHRAYPSADRWTIVTRVRDITERKRDGQILKLEHDVALCMANAEDGSTALKTIMRAICETEGWDLGRYFVVDEPAGLLRFEEAWSKGGPGPEQFIASSLGTTFKRGTGLVGSVWESGEPLWAADAATHPRALHIADVTAANMHGAFMFPVRSDGVIIGVLAFSSLEIQAPDARLLQAVPVIAGQIGQFMAKQAQRRHIARLSRIHLVLSGINSLIVRVRDRDELFREACRISVEDGRFGLAWVGIVDRTEMELRIVASRDPSGSYVELVPLGLAASAPGGLSIAAKAVLERAPIIVNDVAGSSLRLRHEALARGFCSLVVLPLMDAQGVTGVLALYADSAEFFDQAEMKLLLGLAGDISFAIDHLDKADRLDYLAYYDALTGLANRSLFKERMAQHIDEAAAQNKQLAVLVIDIERFKLVNESLGRAAGDSLLQQIAGRMASNRVEHARHARIDADKFAVVLLDVESEQALARRLEEWYEAYFGPRFTVGTAELKIAARVGVALYPNDGGDAEALLANADSALKRAKAGGDKYLFYTEQMSERAAGRLTLENQLRQALERGEFVLHYQPKLNLLTRRISTVEALIRWNSPELGLVQPVQFIPLLEQTGLILDVGAWALHQAVLDYKATQALGTPLRIAVNVSPVQLRRASFVDMVKQVIGTGGEPPGIDLEITESLMMEDIEGNIGKLKAIRALGLNIAIDDFGTGYSSLGYLARLPADALKIDRSFIVSMLDDPNTMTLVSTIISLAHTLNLKVIAEGVETEAQRKILSLIRCDEIQGYLISRPLPLGEMLALTTQLAGRET